MRSRHRTSHRSPDTFSMKIDRFCTSRDKDRNAKQPLPHATVLALSLSFESYSRYNCNERAGSDTFSDTRSTNRNTCSSSIAFPPDERLAPRGRSRCYYEGASRPRAIATLFSRREPGENWSSHGCCTSFWLRHLVARRKRGSPQNSADGWIRGNVVKVIVSLSFRSSYRNHHEVKGHFEPADNVETRKKSVTKDSRLGDWRNSSCSRNEKNKKRKWEIIFLGNFKTIPQPRLQGNCRTIIFQRYRGERDNKIAGTAFLD